MQALRVNPKKRKKIQKRKRKKRINRNRWNPLREKQIKALSYDHVMIMYEHAYDIRLLPFIKFMLT